MMYFIVGLVIGFFAGIFFGRKNKKTVERFNVYAKELEARGKEEAAEIMSRLKG